MSFKKKVLLVVVASILIIALLIPAITYVYYYWRPFGIHVVYGDDPTSQVKVIWFTLRETETKILLVNPDSSTRYISGFSKKFEWVYLHVVELDSLLPNTTYEFKCVGSIESEMYSFRTLAECYNTLKIVVAGDSRFNELVRNKISDLIAREKPEFVLHTGDIVDEGANLQEWLDWFIGYESHLKDNNRLIPVMPTLGNHEDNHTYYYEFYQVKPWYAMSFWNITIFSLNSEFGFDAQREWIENITTNGIILGFWHRAVISAGPHGNATDFYQSVVVHLERRGMIFGFYGHNHNYVRSKPIRNGTLAENGTIYVTTGGWGALLADADSISSWVAHYAKVHHFVVLEISLSVIKMRVYDDTGKLIDFLEVNL